MSNAGRPTSYDTSFCVVAHEMMQAGATDRELADALGISESSLYLYKHKHPEFSQSMKLGKETADDRVEMSLYRRAVGYRYDTVKVMQFEGVVVVEPYVEFVPPDVGAAKMWLTNRRSHEWRDKVDVTNTVSFLDKLDFDELEKVKDAISTVRASRSDSDAAPGESEPT